MKLYIANAFSLSMLDPETQFGEHPRIPHTIDDPVAYLAKRDRAASSLQFPYEVISIVGHPDTAVLFSALLRRKVSCNRAAVQLRGDMMNPEADRALVGQVKAKDGGPYRLPPGTTTLPADAVIEWWIV